jgi:uncharacterized membrane protein YedE/YeeE
VNRLHAVCAVFGIAFGSVFAAAGFNQYDTIHQMLLLEDLEPFLVMGSAVATAMSVLWLLERRRWQTPLGGALELLRWAIERKHLLGGVVFGTGWAITGACPGTAATTLGAGSVMGMVAGIALRDAVAERWQTAFPIDPVAEPVRSGSGQHV